MKAKKIIVSILGILFVALTFYGFYLFIQHLGKDTTMTIISAMMLGVGFIGMCSIAIVFYMKKKGDKKNEEEDKKQ